MYIRRKVFSLGEGNIDYDYNIYQKLYSEAFEDGVNYAIEKMFADFDMAQFNELHKDEQEGFKKALESGMTKEQAWEKVANDRINFAKGSGDEETAKRIKEAYEKHKSNGAKKDGMFKKALGYVKEHPVKTGLGAAATAGLAYGGYKFATRNKKDR